MASEYRALTREEIEVLVGQGCSGGDWSKVKVGDGFQAERVRGVAEVTQHVDR